ncbi:MAG: hypothetical protein E6L08_12110 [Verrucomicrobia bacterium]|nr:MAG: hypothetical protein E6L08_12110 [Verrucomicrobiota bacterium]
MDNEASAKSVILNQSTDLAEYSFFDGAIDMDPRLSAQIYKPVSLRAGERMLDFTTRAQGQQRSVSPRVCARFRS